MRKDIKAHGPKGGLGRIWYNNIISVAIDLPRKILNKVIIILG